MRKGLRQNFAIALAVAVFGMTLFAQQTASAISNVVPDPANFDSSGNTTAPDSYDPDTWLEVAEGGLDAPRSDVRFYMSTISKIYITNGKDNCGSPPDYSDLATTYTFSYFDLNGAQHFWPAVSSASMTCGVYTFDTIAKGINTSNCGNFKLSETQSVCLMELNVVTTAADGVNAFKASIDAGKGYATYFNGLAGDKFAMQDRTNNGNCNPSGSCPDANYTLYFAPSCGISQATINGNPGLYNTLRWFDDDRGGIEPASGIRIRVDRRPYANPAGWVNVDDFYATAGNGVAGSHALPANTVAVDYIYRVTWINVDRNNGIQFSLPFDSVYATVDCRPAYVDGIKVGIDNATGNGSDALTERGITVNESAGSTYPFADNKIVASRPDGSYIHGANSNAFYFKDCSMAPGCNIEGNNQIFNTQLEAMNGVIFSQTAAGTADGSWTLRGYTICDENSPPAGGCTAAFLNNVANLRGSPVNLLHGHRYHMRYLYQKPPQPPKGQVLSSSCRSGVSGWMYDPDNANKQLHYRVQYVTEGTGTRVDYIYGSPGNSGQYTAGDNSPTTDTGATGHGFNLPMDPSLPFTDGLRRTFYIYPKGVGDGGSEDGTNGSADGLQDSGGASATLGQRLMKACGRFTVTSVSTSITLSPSAYAPTSYDAQASVSVGFNSGVATSHFGGAVVSIGTNINVSVNGSPYNSGNGTRDYAINGSAQGFGYNVSGPPRNPVNVGDQYCSFASANYNNGMVEEGNATPFLVVFNPPVTDNNCRGVTGLPFFKAAGASISSGGQFRSSDPSCSGAGTLGSWYSNEGGNWGAGAQFSVFGRGLDKGIASAFGLAAPTGRTFANNNPGDITTNGTNPSLGGNFASTHCLTEFDNPASTVNAANPGTLGSGSITNGVRKYTGSLTINSQTIPAGTNATIIVENGDVYINGPISYGGGWTATTVPSFVLIVNGGSLFIDPGVTDLSGVYQVKPKAASPNKGVIYDCAGGLGSPVVASQLYTTCRNRLVVHGSFIAKNINLMRTYGTLKNEIDGAPCGNAGAVGSAVSITTCAAEVFDLSPAFYLSKPAVYGGDGSLRKNYDAITTLPPIL